MYSSFQDDFVRFVKIRIDYLCKIVMLYTYINTLLSFFV